MTAEHTLEPILTGQRATLVYNLVRTSPGPVPCSPVNPELLGAVDTLVSEWAGLPESEQIAVVPLEHRSVDSVMDRPRSQGLACNSAHAAGTPLIVLSASSA